MVSVQNLKAITMAQCFGATGMPKVLRSSEAAHFHEIIVEPALNERGRGDCSKYNIHVGKTVSVNEGRS